MIAAFFDVEGTLYTGQMWRGLVDYARAHGQRVAVAQYYAAVTVMYALRKAKLASEESMRRLAIARLGLLLKGWTVDEAEAAFDWIVRVQLLPTARRNVMDRLQTHLAQGHAVFLVSGMPNPCLERVGRAVGATGAIGTAFALRDGRYTGGIVPPVMVGAAKREQTFMYAQQHGFDIDWPTSYAYADSIHDRAMLEMVGHPVAVYPDPQLLELAHKQQWSVITE